MWQAGGEAEGGMEEVGSAEAGRPAHHRRSGPGREEEHCQ